MTSGSRQGAMSLLDPLAFLCELAMLAVLAVAGWRFAGLASSIALPVVTAAIWGRWMAPTSSHRLTDPARLVAQVVLFAATAAVSAAAGRWLLGVTFAVVASAVFALSRVTGGVSGS